ncbi:MAG TPA: TadE/TadG family type IV pilus assembly protein, partial [Alphaproteobacteria bacterium]
MTRLSAKALRSYWADRRGTIIAAFAIMLPVVISSVGMSMDMAQGYLVRQRLAGALDAAALAATASETDEDAIRERVEDFFEANYPEEKIGAAYNLEVEVDDDDVIVSAYADYDTSFMRVVGIDTMTVYRRTVIRREVQGLEVVLVLDTTGSMAQGDKIDALKEAATNFVNILFDATDEPERIKIGIVPYANSVRIGRYGLGLLPDGTPYEVDGVQADPFVTLPAGMSFTTSTSSTSNWFGCVVEHNVSMDDVDQDEVDVVMVAGSYGQLWKNTSAACTATNCNAHGWDPSITDNDAYPQNVLDDYEGPWDIYMYGSISQSRTCAQYKCKEFRANGTCR